MSVAEKPARPLVIVRKDKIVEPERVPPSRPRSIVAPKQVVEMVKPVSTATALRVPVRPSARLVVIVRRDKIALAELALLVLELIAVTKPAVQKVALVAPKQVAPAFASNPDNKSLPCDFPCL